MKPLFSPKLNLNGVTGDDEKRVIGKQTKLVCYEVHPDDW